MYRPLRLCTLSDFLPIPLVVVKSNDQVATVSRRIFFTGADTADRPRRLMQPSTEIALSRRQWRGI